MNLRFSDHPPRKGHHRAWHRPQAPRQETCAASGREAWGRACEKIQGPIPAWATTPGKAAALGDPCPSVEGALGRCAFTRAGGGGRGLCSAFDAIQLRCHHPWGCHVEGDTISLVCAVATVVGYGVTVTEPTQKAIHGQQRAARQPREHLWSVQTSLRRSRHQPAHGPQGISCSPRSHVARGTVPDEVRAAPLRTRASTPTVATWAGWPLGAEALGALQDPRVVVSALVPPAPSQAPGPSRRPSTRLSSSPPARPPAEAQSQRPDAGARGVPNTRPRTASERNRELPAP